MKSHFLKLVIVLGVVAFIAIMFMSLGGSLSRRPIGRKLILRAFSDARSTRESVSKHVFLYFSARPSVAHFNDQIVFTVKPDKGIVYHARAATNAMKVTRDVLDQHGLNATIGSDVDLSEWEDDRIADLVIDLLRHAHGLENEEHIRVNAMGGIE